jgi:hypothetical protein
MLLAVLPLLTACAALDEDAEIGTAPQAMCAGAYLANIVYQPNPACAISPDLLLDSTEGLGPLTLLLSVNRHFGPRIQYQSEPSVTIDKGKVQKTLQEVTGVSFNHEYDLVASSSHEVAKGEYERLEAYPTFQVITWELRQDACAFAPDELITRGAIYKPLGVYFRIVDGHSEPQQARQYGSITAIGEPALGLIALGTRR